MAFMTRFFSWFSIFCILLSPVLGWAAGKGEGGCITTHDAPIYGGENSDAIVETKDIGQCVVGATVKGMGFFGVEYRFTERNGRVQIYFLPNPSDSGAYKVGYMRASDLSRFTYECGCGQTSAEKDRCTPFSMLGFMEYEFNPCFKEGAEKVLPNIGAQAKARANTREGPGSRGYDSALHNGDIISLVKAGLDDALIISKIKTSNLIDFDLSTEGLLALRSANVSNAVINAMMARKEK